MKLKLVFITSVLLFISITGFAQYKYNQKLGSLATINLPDTPKLINAKGLELYVSNYKGIIFMAQASDISGGLRDLFRKNNTDSVYNGYINGLLNGTKGKLFYKNKIKIQDHEAFEFGYKAKLNGQETYRYNQIVTLNDTLLLCAIMSSDLVPKESPALNDFFKGFKTKSIRQLELDHATSLGRKTGHVIGILIILSVFVLMGLGIVFLLKKLVYRNNKA